MLARLAKRKSWFKMLPSVNRPIPLALLVLTALCAWLSVATVLAQQPKRLRVGGQVQQAKLLQKVEPVYPAQAKQADIQGKVRLTAVIDTQGRVTDLRVLAGHPLLFPAALDAVQQWRYEPTYVNGEPVEVETLIEVDFQLGEPEPVYFRGSSEVEALAFSADGRILASGGSGVALWEVATGRLLRRLSVEQGLVRAVGFAAEGHWVAAGTEHSVTVWEVETGRVLHTIVADEEMASVAFSPDGKWFAWGGVGRAELRDLNTGLFRRTFPDGVPKRMRAERTTEFSGLADLGKYVVHVEFSRQGDLLVSASMLDGVKVWELESGRERRALEGIEMTIGLNPNGRTLVSAGPRGVTMTDLTTGRQLWQASGHGADVGEVSNSPNSIAPDRSWKRWLMTAIVFSPDGRWVASVSVDKSVRLWDANTGRPARSLPFAVSVAFSPDGRWLATGSVDNTIKLWEVDSGRELRTFADGKPAPTAVP